MKHLISSITTWWMKNFARGIYAGIIFMLIGIIIQFGGLMIGVAILALFPVLDSPENSTLRGILALTGLVIFGIPLFGFLFTRMYEKEEGSSAKPEGKKSNPANKTNQAQQVAAPDS